MNNKTLLEKYVEKEGLPSSPEHEAAILSALLDDKTVFELLTEAGIGKEYFYSPTMKSIYLACWHAVMEATAAHDGGVAHHHGIGRVRKNYLVHDLGETGVALLRTVKNAVDPQGLMNPGNLLPDA